MDEPIHNIQRVVLSSLNALKFYGATMRHYKWMENIAVQFYRTKLRGYNMPSLVSVRTSLTDNSRVWDFPSDLIRYTKVAYEVGGQLVTLGIDESLDLSESPPLCQNGIDEVNNQTLLYGGYWLAPGWGMQKTFYASGGGFTLNYYRPDYEKRRLVFRENLPPGRLVIEYLSSGRGVNGLTLVPIAYEFAFDRYLKYQFCDLNPSLKSAASGFRQEYEDAKWDANVLMGKYPVYEMTDTVYRSSGFHLR